MKIVSPLMKLLASLSVFLLTSPAQAGIPLWAFIPLTKTSISVKRTETARIEYLVVNQSDAPHTLLMTPIRGVSQIASPGYCFSPFTLGSQQFCVLSLLVVGSALADKVEGGPIVCESGNPLQCYQPKVDDRLDISIKKEDRLRN